MRASAKSLIPFFFLCASVTLAQEQSQNEAPAGTAIQSTQIPPRVSAGEFSSGSGESGSMRDRFLGAWELVTTEQRLTDGSKRPYRQAGPNGKGYLIYTADGHMCGELMNPDRPVWKDRRSPSDAEKASAIDGLIAYCGRYEIDETNKVIYHYPEVAWSPNYVGTKQARPYKFNGDLLTFSGKVVDEPGVESYSITWRKATPLASKSKEQ
jgi:hypothetical protein